MQLYIATYFICKIFIGESVTLRTLHYVDLICQNYKICLYFASAYYPGN